MEFIQEPTLTAFLALVLSFVVVKIVSFAVSNTDASADGHGVAKEVKIGKNDVLVRRVNCFEGSANSSLINEVDAAVVRENVVDQLGFHGFRGELGQEDMEEIRDSCAMDDEGCGEIRMMVGEVCGDGDDADEVFGVGEVIQNEELLDEKVDKIMNYGKYEGGRIGRDESAISVDDDWEGIERSELEKAFAVAVNFVEYGWKGMERPNLGSDVQMELYGLHKAAVEGPCHESQPMALKVSARAKWNAWQRLGSMSPEVAMEEYIRVLSDSVPGWMRNHSAGSSSLELVDKIPAPECTREWDSNSTSTPVVDSITGRNSLESVQKLPCGTVCSFTTS